MEFIHVTIHVRNLEESIAFYQDIIGLAIKRRFPVEGGEIAFLGNETGTQVELISRASDPDAAFSQGISLGFAVESCEESLEMFKSKGVEAIGGIITLGPNVRCFFVEDPSGVRLQFVGK